jgi:hypothetical protein
MIVASKETLLLDARVALDEDLRPYRGRMTAELSAVA